MFNQNVNHFTQENPNYLNYSIAPASPQSLKPVSQLDIHKCGTTINKYTKTAPCASLPLQTWCSKNVAVASFAMRPIVNSKEYFQNIKKYLQQLILNDSQTLKNTSMTFENYELLVDYGMEPLNSLLQAVNLEVTNTVNFVMAMSSDGISMFKDFNPICEGFVVTDITIDTMPDNFYDEHFHTAI